MLMHELSVAVALVEQAEQAAKKENAGKIISVTVVIGRVSGVEPEALEFAFNIAAEGTMLEKSRLIIDKIPLKVKCNECGEETCPELPLISCVKCGASNTDIVQGREFLFKSMEIE